MSIKKKILLAILGILIMTFSSVSIIWCTYNNNVWKPIENNVLNNGGSIETFGAYIYRDGNFVCYVTPPSFLHFEGNLQFTHSKDSDYDPNHVHYSTDVLVWPKMNGELIYGVSIDKITGQNYYESALNSYIDPETLKLQDIKDNNEAYLNCKKDIEDIMQFAKDFLSKKTN